MWLIAIIAMQQINFIRQNSEYLEGYAGRVLTKIFAGVDDEMEQDVAMETFL